MQVHPLTPPVEIVAVVVCHHCVRCYHCFVAVDVVAAADDVVVDSLNSPVRAKSFSFSLAIATCLGVVSIN